MGVVNVTPDSFSDGGCFLDHEAAISHGLRLAEEGAAILDIGGESTRPGSVPVSLEEEIQRVVPVLKALGEALPQMTLSIDTSKAKVAEAALKVGASIINDVTAGCGDAEMLPLAASSGAGLVLMHMQGRPKTMQAQPTYENVLAEVYQFFEGRIHAATDSGVALQQIALDPGIGFGKTLQHNLELISGLSSFHDLGCPLLLGVSRKRWLGELTGRGVDDRLAASLGGAAACVSRGAHILRVHDVIESCDLVKIIDSVGAIHLQQT
jgi:dihydropteroate synthase